MALSVKVGSFTKSTGAAPVSQAITGVGFQPKALILFSSGQTAAGVVSNDFFSTFGFSSGASASFAFGGSAQQGSVPTNISGRSAAKVATFCQYGEVTLADADLTSFDSDGFTLNWTTNDANAFIINYLALGGSDLTDVKATTMNIDNGVRAYDCTTIGFRPDAVILLRQVGGPGYPATLSFTTYSLGFAARQSGQFGVGSEAWDANTIGYIRFASGNQPFVSTVANAGYRTRAFVESWHSSGFKLRALENGDTTNNGSGRVAILALKGGSYQVSSLVKPIAAGAASVELPLSFLPRGLLLTGWNDDHYSTTGGWLSHSLGATDGVQGRLQWVSEGYAGGALAHRYQHNSNAFGFAQQGSQAGTIGTQAPVPSLAGLPVSLSFDNVNPNTGADFMFGMLAFGDTPVVVSTPLERVSMFSGR